MNDLNLTVKSVVGADMEDLARLAGEHVADAIDKKAELDNLKGHTKHFVAKMATDWIDKERRQGFKPSMAEAILRAEASKEYLVHLDGLKAAEQIYATAKGKATRTEAERMRIHSQLKFYSQERR